MLSKEEYVEQEFFFRTFQERLDEGFSSQEILGEMKNELLQVTRLPLVVSILLTEIKLSGKMHLAMSRMPHYFTPFQIFIMKEAEREEGRFDFRLALQILEKEAQYRSQNPTPQGIFFYQFETISRNRLGFDYGLEAIANDPIFNEEWKYWINVILRRQIGFVDITKLIYVRSESYTRSEQELDVPLLFGEREGCIAHASEGRDPRFFFSAIARHLGYPSVVKPHSSVEREPLYVTDLRHSIEVLEKKLQLLREELKGGINLEQFYVKKP